MFAKIISIVAFALAVGLYSAVPTAQAKTKKYRGTFKSSGEAIDVIADFSFDGSTTNSAALNTFWTTDSLGDVGPGQVGERVQLRFFSSLHLQGTLRHN